MHSLHAVLEALKKVTVAEEAPGGTFAEGEAMLFLDPSLFFLVKKFFVGF